MTTTAPPVAASLDPTLYAAMWAELREEIQQDRRIYGQQADDYSETPGDGTTEERAWGRVAQCDDLLKLMDRMEAGQ